MSEIDYDALDPGIRDIVRDLRAVGFHTTDSGDGVSKPVNERVFHVPHVAVRVTDLNTLVKQADELLAALVYIDGSYAWRVEASYVPGEGGVLVATKGVESDE